MRILVGRIIRQPQNSLPLDRGGIARGLFAGVSYGGGNLRDLAENRTYSQAGGIVPTPLGLGATVVASTSNVVPSASISLAAGADYTAVFAVNAVGFNGGNPGIWRSATGTDAFNIFQGSTGRPWIRIAGSDTPLKPLSGFGITAGAPCVFAFRVRSAKDAAFASDGIIRHSNTHAIATTAITIAQIGYQSTSAESLSGQYTFIGFWNRALADDELRVVTRNPWQVFQAPRRLQSFGVSAAGGFNAAWAQAANTAIIGGQHAA